MTLEHNFDAAALLLGTERLSDCWWVGGREDILAARAQWQKYMEEAPGYPEGMFAGKGIVILGGGLTYMVPAWVNVHMLRRTGSIPDPLLFSS